MKLSLLVAMAENNAIGKNNQLLWHLPNDLKMFKEKTSGHCIIMGRKTFDSIGKPLPNRTNIIISRQNNLQISGCTVVSSLNEAIEFAKKQNESEAFVVGGGEIYKQALDLADILYVTKVHTTMEADVFFPYINENLWQLSATEPHAKDEKHFYAYDFVTWVKK